ncbi:MAG: hypothetical protein N2Z21_07325 [Candidatus Sumerlaeaceae bacterium]|nr:hypothetical protein [Candidatus Sumerlaeaceae bacterium]
MSSPTPFERATNKALGELLVERGFLTAEQCEQALAYAREHGLRIGEALVQLGFVSHDLLSVALGEQFGTRPMVIDPSMLDLELLERFPVGLLTQHKLLPLLDLGDELIVAVGDPHDREGLNKLSALVPDRRLVLQLANVVEIDKCLAHPRIAQRIGSEWAVKEAGYSRSVVPEERKEIGRVIGQVLDATQAAVCVRLGDTEVTWWKEDDRAMVERLDVGDELLSLEELRRFLSESVEWINDGAVRGGFFGRREDGAVVAVTLVRSVGDIIARFRRWKPYERAFLGSLSCHPMAPLVILLYEDIEVLSESFATLVRDAAPAFPVVVTEYLPWRYLGALQFPVAVPQLVSVLRASGARMVAFDTPVPPSLVALLLLGRPHPETVVVAVAEETWKHNGEMVYGELLRAHEGIVLRATRDGLAPTFQQTRTDQSTAR